MSIPDPFNAARYEDPPAKRLPAPTNPMAVARKVVENYRADDCYTLRRWRGGWMQWARTHWAEVEETVVRSGVYERLDNADAAVPAGELVACANGLLHVGTRKLLRGCPEVRGTSVAARW